MKQAVYEACIILAVAIVLAVAVTVLRPPLFEQRQEDARNATAASNAGAIAVVAIDTAVQWFQKERALFADARSIDEYKRSHIPGAVNLPVSAMDRWLDDFIASTPPEQTIITYCSDAGCHLAEDLAEILLMAGFQNVHHMQAGWIEWKENGWPLVGEGTEP